MDDTTPQKLNKQRTSDLTSLYWTNKYLRLLEEHESPTGFNWETIGKEFTRFVIKEEIKFKKRVKHEWNL